MVTFNLEHINPVLEKWLQYVTWLYHLNITTNKWLYYVMAFAIMIVFVLMSCVLIVYVEYAINRNEHPRLNTWMTTSSAVAMLVITIVLYPALMFPKSAFYLTMSNEVNNEYHDILNVSGKNKVVLNGNELALSSDSGDSLNIVDFSKSTSRKFVLKPVNKTGNAYVKALSQVKPKVNTMYNLKIRIESWGTIVEWQDTKGNHRMITRAE